MTVQTSKNPQVDIAEDNAFLDLPLYFQTPVIT